MKTRSFVIIALLLTLIAYAGRSAAKNDPFSPARDMPRGALVYAQFSDLPSLIKRWSDSGLKAKYLDSENFRDLTKRPLGLKLASRWQEFSDAAGFPIDLAALAGFADGRASVAVYDIGKLDMVFVAPVSDELFAATQLMQNSSRFEEEDLGRGVTAYRVAVEADRGRQKQQMLFTHIKGRLIVATSERLLARTIANMSAPTGKDRLYDEPGFSLLSKRVTPHIATVWIDQAALNDDYYFKRYWLMKDTAKLKNVRSGMFDLSIAEGQVKEAREFLLSKPEQPSAVSVADGRNLLSHVPADTSLFRISAGNSESVNSAVREILAVQDNSAKTPEQTASHPSFRGYREYESQEGSFRNLGTDFDKNINDMPENEIETTDKKQDLDIAPVLAPARPTAILSISQPRMLEKPLFAKFNYAAVFRLGSPAGFDRAAFEKAIERTLVERVMIPRAETIPAWTTQNTNGVGYRELAFPMLAWKVSYAISGNELFVANNSELLIEIHEAKNSSRGVGPDKAFSDWWVMDLKQSYKQFDLLFHQLENGNASNDFFSGNIGSLIATVPEGARVEVERSSSTIFTHEDVTMYLTLSQGEK